jgi:hypothetical protein
MRVCGLFALFSAPCAVGLALCTGAKLYIDLFHLLRCYSENCEGLEGCSSSLRLELQEGFLVLFLGLNTHSFHLVNTIIEISWSREEIWEKGIDRFCSMFLEPF